MRESTHRLTCFRRNLKPRTLGAPWLGFGQRQKAGLPLESRATCVALQGRSREMGDITMWPPAGGLPQPLCWRDQPSQETGSLRALMLSLPIMKSYGQGGAQNLVIDRRPAGAGKPRGDFIAGVGNGQEWGKGALQSAALVFLVFLLVWHHRESPI